VATPSKGVRATPARITELREEIAAENGRLHQRIDELQAQLSQRDAFARRLAHNIGIAVTAALRDTSTVLVQQQQGDH
jgi:hypothetical protein